MRRGEEAGRGKRGVALVLRPQVRQSEAGRQPEQSLLGFKRCIGMH